MPTSQSELFLHEMLGLKSESIPIVVLSNMLHDLKRLTLELEFGHIDLLLFREETSMIFSLGIEILLVEKSLYQFVSLILVLRIYLVY